MRRLPDSDEWQVPEWVWSVPWAGRYRWRATMRGCNQLLHQWWVRWG